MPYHDTAGLGPQGFLEDEDEDEADDYFDSKLYSIQISDQNSPTARIYLHDAEYNQRQNRTENSGYPLMPPHPMII